MEYIDLAQSQEEVKNKMIVAIKNYDQGNLQSQAIAGRALVAQNEGLKSALKIAGDCIYDKSIENDTLRSMIGNVDEDFVQQVVSEKKTNDTNDDKNKRILEELKRTMNKTKQLK